MAKVLAAEVLRATWSAGRQRGKNKPPCHWTKTEVTERRALGFSGNQTDGKYPLCPLYDNCIFL